MSTPLPPSGPSFAAITDFLYQDRQGNEGLTSADRLLATLGCLLALGADSPELDTLWHTALVGGVSPTRLETMLIHAVGYLGIVRTRQAERRLRAALEALGRSTELASPTPSQPIEPERARRVSQGAALYDRFDPGRQAQQARMFEALSADYYPRAMELSGLVLADPSFAPRERQIMTVAMLSSLGGQADQLRFHLGVALRSGVSPEVVGGILILVQAYAGMPRANSAAALALQAIDEHAAIDHAQTGEEAQ